MQSFGAVGAQLHDGEGGSTSQGSPYLPSNQSGEDSDSFDTEGDSESYSSERVCEVRSGCIYYGCFSLHGTVRLGMARIGALPTHGMVRLGSVRLTLWRFSTTWYGSKKV